jgi:hypothetical protein
MVSPSDFFVSVLDMLRSKKALFGLRIAQRLLFWLKPSLFPATMSVRPFNICIPESEVADLHARFAASFLLRQTHAFGRLEHARIAPRLDDTWSAGASRPFVEVCCCLMHKDIRQQSSHFPVYSELGGALSPLVQLAAARGAAQPHHAAVHHGHRWVPHPFCAPAIAACRRRPTSAASRSV